jgi:hypothetical protein
MEAAKEKKRWESFITEHAESLRELGMPEDLFREKRAFDHWLMHGYHPLDPVGFSVEQLDPSKKEVLVGLIGAYMDAGFSDPGIAILSRDERTRLSLVQEARGSHQGPKRHR